MKNNGRKIMPIIVLILGIIVFSIYSGWEKNLTISTTELLRVLSFPQEDENVYITDPVNMVVLDDSIYISDYRISQIHVYDQSGSHVRSIGGHGSGPTEFMAQRIIGYNDGTLYVLDQGNHRFTAIDLDRNEFTVHPIMDVYHPFSFVVREGVVYANTPYPPSERDNLDKLPLIHVYELNDGMRRIADFGERLNFISGMFPDASMSQLKIFDNKLYVQFNTYPILRIYSLDGALIETIEYDHRELDYAVRAADNYRSETFRDLESRRARTLVSNFDVNERGLFLHIYDADELIIDHFDHNANFIRRYKKEHSPDVVFVNDMKAVINNNDELLFYVLYRRDNPGVDVYVDEMVKHSGD
jgi:hypothetical protein